MLPKQFRLKNKNAFDATYKNHKVVSNSCMTIFIGKEKKSSEQQTKFGIVVSKKYHKRAVKRNRIKRLVRESLRLAIKNNNLKKLENYLSFIVLPKSTEENYKANFKEVNASLLKLIEKIR